MAQNAHYSESDSNILTPDPTMSKCTWVFKYNPSGDINPVWWYMIVNADKTEPKASTDNQSVQVTKEILAEYQRACIKDKTKIPPTHIVSPSTGLYSMLVHPVERGIFAGGTNEALFDVAKGLVGQSLHGGGRHIRFPEERPIQWFGYRAVIDAVIGIRETTGANIDHVTIDRGISAYEPGYSANNNHSMERIETTYSVFLYEPGVSASLSITDGKKQVKRWRVDSGMMLVWSARDNDAGFERCLVSTGECIIVTFRCANAFCLDAADRVCEWTPLGYRSTGSHGSTK